MKKKWVWIGSGIGALLVIGGISNAITGGPDTPPPTDEAPVVDTTPAPAAPLETEAPAPAVSPAATTPADATPSGLTFGSASVACDRAGDDQYPYGFKASWLWDGIHRVNGDTMFLKAGGKITNEYGAKASMTIECTVGGTDDAPTVQSLLAY